MITIMKPYLTATETAAVLNVSTHTVYNMIHNGKIVAKKAGKQWLIANEDLEDHISMSKTVNG